jgi:hypothetical protein
MTTGGDWIDWRGLQERYPLRSRRALKQLQRSAGFPAGQKFGVGQYWLRASLDQWDAAVVARSSTPSKDKTECA